MASLCRSHLRIPSARKCISAPIAISHLQSCPREGRTPPLVIRSQAFSTSQLLKERYDPWHEYRIKRLEERRRAEQARWDAKNNNSSEGNEWWDRRGPNGEPIKPINIMPVIYLSAGGATIFYFTNLEKVPISGRTRFNCYSAESAEKQGIQAYQEILQDARQQGAIYPDHHPTVQRVRRVLERLINGAHLGSGGSAEGSGWEVHVIHDPRTQNAFVLPGGKVFVYDGILPVCGTDEGLAAVLSHELAHNVAQHGAEAMSSAIPITILGYTLHLVDYLFGTMVLAQMVGSWVLNYGVMKPGTRKQESEADYIGLLIMAESCYDPEAAVDFWHRMQSMEKEGGPAEWQSTHPSNENRIASIKKWLPLAQEKRESSGCAMTQTYAEDFKQAFGFGKSVDSDVFSALFGTRR